MLSSSDLVQISSRGMTATIVEKQIRHFEQGFPYARLARPATGGDGILLFPEATAREYERFFDRAVKGQTPVKFVPASGAATRMFKDLFEFGEKPSESVRHLISHLEETAFYNALAEALKRRGLNLETLRTHGGGQEIIDTILSADGLNYAALPKGLLLFHNYPAGARTAAEEHLVEAALYATDDRLTARIHFTISREHQGRFAELFGRVVPEYEQLLGVRFEISFSVQKPSTDTLAVDEQNNPFRNADGSLLFRPGGHGALLTNLNDLQADLVFIKNIDNVVPDRLKAPTILYKKAIGGYLLEMRERVFRFLSEAAARKMRDAELDEMGEFARKNLMITLPERFHRESPEVKQNLLFHRLDRPMRVCGMVKNEGEPGGGPFWVRGPDGSLTLQIIESSQVDLRDPEQKALMDQSTHFNPVDLVCSMKDYRGKPFDLPAFVDESTGFISLKSSGGRTLKAQELPGLWNGAMAGWITVFAEVPVITFNPVKTINDLLRPEHRSA
jgi:hypothetical protein